MVIGNEEDEKGVAAAEAFENKLKSDDKLRRLVEEQMNSIVKIGNDAGYSFTKDDMNKFLKKKHNPPPSSDTDTCFSEPPSM